MSKKYIPSKISGNKGEAKALLLFTENHFLVRSQYQNDFGVDMEIELTNLNKDGERIATGLLAKIQVKHQKEVQNTWALSDKEVAYYKGMLNIPLFYILITEDNKYSICDYHTAKRNVLKFDNWSDLYNIKKKQVILNNAQMAEMISAIHTFNVRAESAIIFNVLRSLYKILHENDNQDDKETFVHLRQAIIHQRAISNRMEDETYIKDLTELSKMDKGVLKLLKGL